MLVKHRLRRLTRAIAGLTVHVQQESVRQERENTMTKGTLAEIKKEIGEVRSSWDNVKGRMNNLEIRAGQAAELAGSGTGSNEEAAQIMNEIKDELNKLQAEMDGALGGGSGSGGGGAGTDNGSGGAAGPGGGGGAEGSGGGGGGGAEGQGGGFPPVV